MVKETGADFQIDLPFGPPPILPDIQQQLRQYITHPDLPINDNLSTQQHWQRTANPNALLSFDVSDVASTIKMKRDPTTGQIIGSAEVSIAGSGDLRGNEININSITDILKSADNFDFGKLLTIPPGFERGFDFSKEPSIICDNESKEADNESHVVDLAQILQGQHFFLEDLIESEVSDPKKLEVQEVDDELEVLTKDVVIRAPVIRISDIAAPRIITSTEWAELVDVSNPVPDFHQRIPNMAFKYEFELDNFQKQAILKLEERCNVLVSAHTSAGKTVVAEYAIALSQRHMTRTIYTSPIKALSNQKYRDFRRTFQDVGLITGDFQVNATGVCLVMTTEILRSMLLAQNEVIRDLEFVIFDEVHYINNMERGHVWEEVVILLPPHVSIVMLSATVPNALEFADWVGRTKRRRMYVVSTLFRPVPLKHYLYTGSGGSSKDDRFLIMDKNKFIPHGYAAAVQAKQQRKSKSKSAAPEGRRTVLGPKQEQTLWVALLGHLMARDELPVVVFTLSRKRCDDNAEALGMDLTTSKEKSHIRHFFHNCVQRLNQADRDLPQVKRMQEFLENGIGVHHSGILPILKEIVELLFQERFVKVLFATETFAMGVNMPAKTVVFDSILKFDGITKRLLLPSEYIQMAGRAGRRGLDENGNVIIVCKGDVWPEHELHSMMTGQPLKIESQFRLTYSVILKLERKRVAAGRVTVEELMANSFMEAGHVKQKQSHQNLLQDVEQKLVEADVAADKGPVWERLQMVSKNGLDFLELWQSLSAKVLSSKTALKLMTPGRVVCVSHRENMKLGVLLHAEYKRDTRFRILVLDENRTEEVSESLTQFKKVLSLMSNKIYVPSILGGHIVLTVPTSDIIDVTKITIKLDPKIVLNDWENRQIPRFKDNPPGQSFQRALEDLIAVTHQTQMSDELETMPLLKDMASACDEDLESIMRIAEIRKTLRAFNKEDIIDWEQQLEHVFRVISLEKQKEHLKFLLSYQSLSLYSDYQNRLLVLQQLGYVDNRNSVQMKGNVACEMSNHELLITELVLRNTLNHLHPAEIAALLSCFVYQGQESGTAISVTDNLLQAIETIKDIEKEVLAIERQCCVAPNGPFGLERGLNFDLVPVVYEWALEKPFSQIKDMTPIQEGIIVRCIQQLNEAIRDVRDAARIVGDPTLQQKMEEASNAIKRDIVFAASLYMQ